MKKVFYLLVFALLYCNLAQSQNTESLKLIPYPKEIKTFSGKLNFQSINLNFEKIDKDNITGIEYSLNRFLPDLKIKNGKNALNIHCRIRKRFQNEEAYRLKVGKNEVLIEALNPKGVFYGIQTLIQLVEKENNKFILPMVEINDFPAFAIRGFMHDVGRNFQTIESLKKQLDFFALYKLNVFHWHLTDHPAWRIQCNVYPQLNKAEFQRKGRNEGAFYTYDEIRDLITYAKERNILVIPEIDVPGHSSYFEKTFGFKMASPEGMKVLEDCFTEFFNEIPASICPYIHLGSDEVHISNPKEFMEKMETIALRNGRKPIVWEPGLNAKNTTIRQIWRDEDISSDEKNTQKKLDAPYIDASMGYINTLDPLILIQRIFLRTACFRAVGDSLALGGILCCWNDIRVDDKQNILRHNAVYPACLSFAERYWRGGVTKELKSLMYAPEKDTEAYANLKDFERRMVENQNTFFVDEPFPWTPNVEVCWKISTPFHNDGNIQKSLMPEVDIRDNYTTTNEDIQWNEVGGGTIDVEYFNNLLGFNKKDSVTVYALSYIHSDSLRTVPFWIGFETPARSNRQWAGIPALGQWDANGGNVWINNTPVPPPIWNAPQTNRFLTPTWTKPAEEIPYTNEEFYWTRPATEIKLKKGWNKVLIRIPKSYGRQHWSFTFVPLSFQGLRFATQID